MTTESANSPIHLSIIVPILNERGNLFDLHSLLTKVLTHLNYPYEIIFVDDGSTDGSVKQCQAFVDSDPHTVLVALRRNFGKATALQAGFQIAQGDIVITMDGDLQDDPEEIPRFLEKLESGFDLVSGWKESRQDPITKTLPSRVFNFVTSTLTGIALRDFNCGFKAYRKEAIQDLDLYGELHRFIPVLVHQKGFRVGEISVRHHPRHYGKSKYNFQRFLRGAFDLLTVLLLSNFLHRPLHFFGLLGSILTLVGFGIDGYLAVLWFLGKVIGNRPLLMFGTLLITVGMQVLLFGLLAEIITAKTYGRSEVWGLIRQVYRQAAANSPSQLTARPFSEAVPRMEPKSPVVARRVYRDREMDYPVDG